MNDNLKKIKPLFDYVLIEPSEAETTTQSGIIIPDTANKEKPQKGTVIAVGPGRTNDKGDVLKMVVTEGDTVMYKKWGGTEIKVNNKEYLLVKEEDLLAICK